MWSRNRRDFIANYVLEQRPYLNSAIWVPAETEQG